MTDDVRLGPPSPLTIEELFNAHDNAAAVAKLREWCDKTEAASHHSPLRWRESEAVFQARMELVDEVRRLLPEVTS